MRFESLKWKAPHVEYQFVVEGNNAGGDPWRVMQDLKGECFELWDGDHRYNQSVSDRLIMYLLDDFWVFCLENRLMDEESEAFALKKTKQLKFEGKKIRNGLPFEKYEHQ